MNDINIAAIRINHDHIHGQVNCLEAAGARLTAFFEPEEALAAPFAARYPHARRVDDPRRIFEDDSVAVVLTSAVPADRADISIAAMRHGKDVLSDKPGMTTFDQLAELRRVQKETGRIYGVLYSEHFEVRATVEAGRLVAAGAIGEVMNTVGLGPHRVGNSRPGWFFERPRYGGILCDIASHQFEQFLFFSDATDGQVISASVANRAHPGTPGLQDVGDVHLTTERTSGYVRVDWQTPGGLPTWGDGRLTILGSEGYIELRKYIDIAGRPGGDHLFLVDADGTRHIDCTPVELPFGRQFLDDVRNRTETAMPQERCFNAMKLALTAQKMAEEGTEWEQ